MLSLSSARGLRGIVSSVTRRLRGTRAPERLAEVLQPLAPPPPLIEYIAADIVNNCNLRCPFCLVDYSGVKKTDLMTEETFRSLLRLAPAAPEGTFWISCLHEPTLHPKLGEFIEMIPREQRRKFWFTTNLARPLPAALIETFATSGFHHINISLDTLDDELFAFLRKHGKLKTFRQNLDLLVDAFRRTPGAPAIRYITMAYRSNLHEIPGMVRWMNESALASQIEIRYTFNAAPISDEFRQEQFLTRDEWQTLDRALREQPYTNYLLIQPPEGYGQVVEGAANWFESVPVTPPPHRNFKRPLPLRVRPDGRIHLSGNESVFAVKVTDLEDPVAFLADICSEG